jgi:Flp pilus assembly protein TadB
MMWLLPAAAVLAGAHPVAAAVVAFALVSPRLFLGSVALWAVVNGAGRLGDRTRLVLAEARFFGALAAEVEAGASLRHGLLAAAETAAELPVHGAARLAASGSPMRLVAGELAEALPENGRLAAAALECASVTGAASEATFRSLALRASDRVELERERRVGTAQARLTALAVGGAPLVLVLALTMSGRGPSWDGAAAMAAWAGIAMISTGSAFVLAILGRRHSR